MVNEEKTLCYGDHPPEHGFGEDELSACHEQIINEGYFVNPLLTSWWPFEGPEWEEYVKKNGDGFKKFDMDRLIDGANHEKL